jgi:NADPH:quinone reductase-like Zn-dependent oxidoreductase
MTTMTAPRSNHSATPTVSTIPDLMRAAAIDRFGPPSVLKIHELPVPQIDSDEVLIEVHTAGVGSWDADMRGGWWPAGKPKFPLVLGTDGSGTVAATGSRVRRFSVGDRVYGYSWMNPKGGFYAQYVAVSAENTAPVPQGLNLKEAGAVPVIGLTAVQGIDDALHLRKGENVIIHGASGGVGTCAVQFAKLRGARVLGTGTGKEGAALVRRLGADVAVDGKNDDLASVAGDFAPDGVDAILALVGGPTLTQLMSALRPGGRVAYPNGVDPAPRKRHGIKILSYDAQPGVRQFRALNRAIEQSKLKVVISGEFPLDRAAGAHQRIARGHILGKVILRIGGAARAGDQRVG